MIEAQGLTKEYPGKRGAFDVTFTVNTGEVVGFLGRNGAGKSTVLNMLSGCLTPDSGEVLADGVSLAQEPALAKAKIGYLPEKPPLYPDMTVLAYLNFVAALKRLKKGRSEAVAAALAAVQITAVQHRLIGKLSKGYQQRVGIAQALLGDPPILLLDEPTVGLDPSQLLEFRQLIGELGKRRAVLLSSHILSEIQTVASRIILLKDGRVAADDTTEHLLASFSGAGRFLVTAPEAGPELMQTLSQVAGVTQVAPVELDLEEVFLQMTRERREEP